MDTLGFMKRRFQGRGGKAVGLTLSLFMPLLFSFILAYLAQGATGGHDPLQTRFSSPLMDLHIYKTDGEHYVLPGSTLTYTIHFSNTWATISPGFHLVELPPGQVDVLSGDGWKEEIPGEGVWIYPKSGEISLEPGETMSTTFKVTVWTTATYGVLDNRVEFSLPPEDDATPEDNRYTDKDRVVPGFNFLYLPWMAKGYAP